MSISLKITPCLWFESNALEAAQFYTSVFPSSAIGQVHKAGSDAPGPKIGDVLMVTFTLSGQVYQGLYGRPHDRFNDAISLSVSCEDQAEVDRLWTALTADGGKPVQCRPAEGQVWTDLARPTSSRHARRGPSTCSRAPMAG